MAAKKRATASAAEVLSAVMKGTLSGLILKKRVTLAAAEEALDLTQGLLDEGKLSAIREFVTKERKRSLDITLPTHVKRKVGEKCLYKVRRVGKRGPQLPLPLAALLGDADDENVWVSFENGCIVVTRVKP